MRTRVNTIEATYERPRVNVKVERGNRSEVQLLRLRVTFPILSLFHLRDSGNPPLGSVYMEWGTPVLGVCFFCFHALGDTKQKKPTPLDRGPTLHVNRPLGTVQTSRFRCAKSNANEQRQ